jgi:hypothetical protein
VKRGLSKVRIFGVFHYVKVRKIQIFNLILLVALWLREKSFARAKTGGNCELAYASTSGREPGCRRLF